MLRDKELEDKWLRELRSGTPQTHGALRDERGECCLGLLARVAGIPLSKDGVTCAQGTYTPIYDLFADKKSGVHCYELNDGINIRKHTFSEIADIVEEWEDKR